MMTPESVLEIHPQDAFNSISGMKDLALCNLAFLSGRFPETNYHLGPLHPESIPHAGKFRELTSRGFVTIDSQPPELSRGLRQISYVTGVIPTEHLYEMVQFLAKNKYRIWYTVNTGKQCFGNITDEGKTVTMFRTCVTETCTCKSFPPCRPGVDQPWRKFTRIPRAGCSIDCMIPKELYHAEKFAEVCVTCKRFGLAANSEEIVWELVKDWPQIWDPNVFLGQ